MLQLATRLRDYVLENKPSSLQKRWARVTQKQRDLMGTGEETRYEAKNIN
jgi:hypothetical protein